MAAASANGRYEDDDREKRTGWWRTGAAASGAHANRNDGIDEPQRRVTPDRTGRYLGYWRVAEAPTGLVRRRRTELGARHDLRTQSAYSSGGRDRAYFRPLHRLL